VLSNFNRKGLEGMGMGENEGVVVSPFGDIRVKRDISRVGCLDVRDRVLDYSCECRQTVPSTTSKLSLKLVQQGITLQSKSRP